MKIIFFTDTYKPQVNGVVTSIDLFSRELKKRGHDVHIICPKDKKSPEEKNVHYLKSLKFKPYPEYRIGIPSPRVLKITKKISPDIIHIHGPFSMGVLGLSVAKYKKIPVVMTYHTFITNYTHYLTKRKFLDKYNKKIAKKYTKWFFNKSDTVIAPSTPIKKILKNYGIRKNIEVIPTGIKTKKKTKTKKFETPTILHVGRVTKEKRIDHLIKAFAKLKDKQYQLIITSEGPYRKELERFVKKNKIENVKFYGYVSDKKMEELYKKSHLFACASKSETQGLVLLEAMSNGCPVLVSESMGFKDFVIDGVNGMFFKKESEIPDKIEEIIKDKKLRKILIKNGYETTKKYTMKNCCKKLEKVYKKLVIKNEE